MITEHKIDLLIINPLTNLTYMFTKRINLTGIYGLKQLDINQITDMTGKLAGFENLTYLSDISKWGTSNVVKILALFENVLLLKLFPNIISPKYFKMGYK